MLTRDDILASRIIRIAALIFGLINVALCILTMILCRDIFNRSTLYVSYDFEEHVHLFIAAGALLIGQLIGFVGIAMQYIWISKTDVYVTCGVLACSFIRAWFVPILWAVVGWSFWMGVVMSVYYTDLEETKKKRGYGGASKV